MVAAARAEGRACPGCGGRGPERICLACGTPRWAGDFAIARRLEPGVYEAFDPEGRRVRVQELVPAEDPSEALLEAFEALAARLKRAAHPALPSWRDALAADGRLYAVQYLPEGPALAARLSREGLPATPALALARGLLEALASLHGGLPRLVHADVRAENVIVGEGGVPFLVGSGLFAALLAAGPEKTLWDARDPTRDLRAAGALLFRLADRFGRRPDEVADVDAALAESPWDAPERAFVARLLERPGTVPFRRATEAREAAVALLERPRPPSRVRRIAETAIAAGLFLRRATKWARYAALVLLGLTPGYLAGAGLLPWGRTPPDDARPPPKPSRPKPSGPENPWESGGLRGLTGEAPVVAVGYASPGCAGCDRAITLLERLAAERPERPRVMTLLAFDPADPAQKTWARAYRAAALQGRAAEFAAFAAGGVPAAEATVAWAEAAGLDAGLVTGPALDARNVREARSAGSRALAAPLVYVDGTPVAPEESAVAAALARAARR